MKSSMTVLAVILALPCASRAAAPALTIIVSVDQMRADYMTRFAKEFTGGFARLARDGAVFTQARHGHVPTETAPGHAALITGCFPSQHGVVGNEWWDKKTSRAIYAVEDPERWRGPVNLECPTLGDALKASSPASRVVSVSGKDRAAILMGGHKADLALWYDKGAGQFVTSGVYGRMPDWVWAWGDSLRIPVAERSKLYSTTRIDDLTLTLASTAIDEERLGTRGVSDLLAISLSATDIIGHAVGPDAPEMREHLLALDRSLGALLDGLDRRFGRDGYALALSSDHGVAPFPETTAQPGALRLSRHGLQRDLEAALRAKVGAPTKPGADWVLDVHSPYVYLDLAAADAAKIGAPRLIAAAVDWTSRHPAVAHVYSAADLAGEAGGPFADEFRRSYHPRRSGDLMILFKRGVIPTDSPTGAVHGLPYDDDAHIPLIFLGAGIKAGKRGERALATDLAPTLAHLLGIGLEPRAPSRVLVEALSEAPPAPKL